MRVPVAWLREYVEVKASPEELAERLTFAGLEVEGVETVEGEPVLEIEVTPNRPDCLSVIGVAREVAALYGTRIRLPAVDFAEAGPPVGEGAKVEVRDAKGCPRYTARVLTGVRVGESPDGMRRRLVQCGMNPINNVVDITNYVLLECGHPLHAFDRDLLRESRIVVRRAAKSEKMDTLDGVSRELTPSMLVIADAERAMAVAGVMGGAESEIRPATRSVLLESAYFLPADIRRTSKALGLSTESSYRFERGADVGIVDWASRRAASLLVRHAGAVAAKGVLDVYPKPRKEKRVRCRFDRVRDLLGIDVSDARIAEIFEALELPVVSRTRSGCEVRVPTFRVDLEQEVDLIEEVARIHGLDKVPDDRPSACAEATTDDRPLRAAMALRDRLAALGLCEILNTSYVTEDLLALSDSGGKDRWVRVTNPNSACSGPLRPSLLPQMLESLGRNLARQVADAALFETGRVFFRGEGGRICEEDRVSVGLMGKVGRVGLDRRRPVKAEESFLWLKGVVEHLLSLQHVAAEQLKPVSHPLFLEGWALSILSGDAAFGVMGVVREELCRHWRMGEPVAVAEFALPPLLAHAGDLPRLQPVPAYPAVSRDVAVVVGEGVSHEDVLRCIRTNAPPELTRVELFDIYRSMGIGSGRKSMAYSLVFRSLERTLTDEDANAFRRKIRDALKSELQAEIRED